MNRINFFFIASLLSVNCVFASSWTPTNGGVACTPVSQTKSPVYMPNGGPVIWPWGKEITFPWSGIQGVWQISSNVCSKLYVFRVIRQSATEKVLDITNYDPVSCRILASGKGVESNRVVKAVLASAGRSYEFTVHAFNPVDLMGARRPVGPRFQTEPVLVMTVFPIGGPATQRKFYKLDRVEKIPSMLCE